jgi:hypothetical protein
MLLLIFSPAIYSQQALSTVTSAGGDNTGAGGVVNYSIGQLVVSSNTGGTAHSDEGVQAVIVNLVLPVTLVNFTGECREGRVMLSWQTSAEHNNKAFAVESSNDAQHWDQLTSIDGAGNSSTVHNYNYVDAAPFAKAGYYRLKQTDLDGSFSYSGIVYVIACGNDKPSIALYPNPAADGVYINTASFKNMRYELRSTAGRLLIQNNISSATTYIPLQNLPKAIYLLTVIQNEAPVQTFKILKN